MSVLWIDGMGNEGCLEKEEAGEQTGLEAWKQSPYKQMNMIEDRKFHKGCVHKVTIKIFFKRIVHLNLKSQAEPFKLGTSIL